MLKAKQHCAVIGAGIVGSSCAWHLQRKGFEVTLIDIVPPGQSCSSGNASCLSTSSVIPFSYPGIIRKVPHWMLDPLGPMSIRLKDFPALFPWFWKFWRVSSMRNVERIAEAQTLLMRTVFDDFDEMLHATDSTHLRRSRGAIHVYDTQREYRREKWQIELRARLGFETHRLSRADVASLAPCLKLGGGVALMMPDWQHLLDPEKVTARFAEHCFANGGNWVQDRVTRVKTTAEGISLQMESGGRKRADKLVIAAGAWSNIFAEQLDYKVPMVAKRGYHSMIANPGIELNCPVMSLSKVFVMTPMEDGLRIAGTAEFAELDAEPNYQRAKVLLKHASQYLEGLKFEGVSEWMGQRPMMSDSLPVISVSPRNPEVFYAFGHGHYGLTQGPTTGRIIADMVVGHATSIDLKPYRFDRFAKP